MQGTSFASEFDPRSNSLNALRLVLATLVIVTHAHHIGGYDGSWDRIAGRQVGDWAVAGFFAISGYLILGSRERSATLWAFLWRRVLRIYPAFWMVLLVVAVLFAPVAAVREGVDYAIADAIRYVVVNATLYIAQWGIGDTLTTVPVAGVWNGSLWTLMYEFACYVVAGVIVSWMPRAARGAGLLVAWASCVVVSFVAEAPDAGLPGTVTAFGWLGAFFFAGALVYAYGQRLRISAVSVVAALAAAAIVVLLGAPFALLSPPVAYLLLAASVRLPLRKVAARNDPSYGVYIYGYPVQQSLVLAGADSLPFLLFTVLSVTATLPFAYASWFLVERPAKNLGRRRVRPRV